MMRDIIYTFTHTFTGGVRAMPESIGSIRKTYNPGLRVG